MVDLPKAAVVALGLIGLGGMTAACAQAGYYGDPGYYTVSPYGYGYAPYHSGFSGSGGNRPAGSRGGP